MSDARRISTMLLAGLLTLGSVAAAPERVTSAGLAEELQKLGRETGGRVWLRYTVPMLAGEHSLCCYGENERGVRECCDLEHDSLSVTDDDEFVPEDGLELQVYLGLDDGELVRVRAYDTECRVKPRRGTVHDVSGIDAGDSVAFLSGQMRADREDVCEGATMAIAFHSHPAAAKALTDATHTREVAELRQNAAFWLGVTRPDESFETLRRMVLQDPSADLREHGVFVLSMSETDRATDFLFELAREGEDADVRGQALFWLGQKAGERVAETLATAAFDDPELNVWSCGSRTIERSVRSGEAGFG